MVGTVKDTDETQKGNERNGLSGVYSFCAKESTAVEMKDQARYNDFRQCDAIIWETHSWK